MNLNSHIRKLILALLIAIVGSLALSLVHLLREGGHTASLESEAFFGLDAELFTCSGLGDHGCACCPDADGKNYFPFEPIIICYRAKTG